LSSAARLKNLDFFELRDEGINPIEISLDPAKQQSFHRYLHPYFTKQAGNVVQEYIKHFSSRGEIVCDPFCGTGVVGIEALTLGRSSICVDLSPLAEFMTRVLISSEFSISEYDDAVEKVIAETESFCLRVEKIGSTKPMRNLRDLPSWVRAAKVNMPDLSMKLPSNADAETVADLFDARQIIVGAAIRESIQTIKNKSVRDALSLALCGSLARSNLTYLVSSSRGGSVLHNGGPSIFGEYRYHLPKTPIYVPMFEMFRRRTKYIRDIKTKTNEIYSHNSNEISASVIRGDSTQLSKLIKPNSIDYIYTDPPYGAHIAYLDLASMWSSWMGWKVSEKDKKAEVIEGGENGKSRQDYLDLLAQSMEESYKVLKPGRWLSLVFQHKDADIWESIVDNLADVGFQYRNTVVQRTFNTSILKKKNPVGVLAEQLVLNFTKPHRVQIHFSKVNASAEDLVLAGIKKAIQLYSGANIDEVYNTLTPLLIESGMLGEASKIKKLVPDLLTEFCRLNSETKKYFLKSKTADAVDSSPILFTMFLRQKLIGRGALKDVTPFVNAKAPLRKIQLAPAANGGGSGVNFIDKQAPESIVDFVTGYESSRLGVKTESAAKAFLSRLEARYCKRVRNLDAAATSNGLVALALISVSEPSLNILDSKLTKDILRKYLHSGDSQFLNSLVENLSHNVTSRGEMTPTMAV
jgi:DNA modification methylase